jgi:hypothetical protein
LKDGEDGEDGEDSVRRSMIGRKVMPDVTNFSVLSVVSVLSVL